VNKGYPSKKLTKHSVDTTRTKRKTTTSASSTSNPVTEKSSSNKRRKKIKRERENQQSTTIHKTSTTQQEAKTRQPQIVKEITKELTHNEELGRGKRYKTKTLKQMQNEEDNKLRSALWKAKQKKQ
jgi:NAD(P)H-dependent flavin oxidoreductase YrpB (nitropropane dioxygenase family)